jgi:hypothetical protein
MHIASYFGLAPRLGVAALIALVPLSQAVWGQAKDSTYYRFELDGNAGYTTMQGGGSSGSNGAAGGGFTMGYRATKHIMVESGVDYRYGNLFPEVAATAQDSSGKQSSATITDHTVFVPIGGRALFPFQHERVVLSAGGGAGVFHNFQNAVGGGNAIDCNGFCRSQTAVGPYETVQALFMLDKRGHIGAGFGARFSQVTLKGVSYSTVPMTGAPISQTVERHNWLQVTASISFRF